MIYKYATSGALNLKKLRRGILLQEPHGLVSAWSSQEGGSIFQKSTRTQGMKQPPHLHPKRRSLQNLHSPVTCLSYLSLLAERKYLTPTVTGGNSQFVGVSSLYSAVSSNRRPGKGASQRRTVHEAHEEAKVTRGNHSSFLDLTQAT